MSEVKKKKKKTTTKRKPKRHIRKSLLFGMIAFLIVLIGVLVVPRMYTNYRLKKLGYDNAAIKIIREEKLQKTILSNGYYSENLAKAIKNNDLNTDYIQLYTYIPASSTLEANDFLLYNRLLDRGYEEDQLQNLYANLQFNELTPLLIFDYQWNEQEYIDDCIENRETNTNGTFSLTNDYYTKYRLPQEISDPEAIDALVNTQHYYSEDYEISDLVTIDSQYGVAGVELRKEAAEQFEEMAYNALLEKCNFYAATGYRSYEVQASSYDYYVNSIGEEAAKKVAFQAGYSEHQSGLAVNVVSTYDSAAFEETVVYQWLNQHAEEYGFIQRYPSNKAAITGVDDEPDHYRYIGKDLAQAVNASGLTFDEYYCLYIADWSDEQNKPAEAIITAADPLS